MSPQLAQPTLQNPILNGILSFGQKNGPKSCQKMTQKLGQPSRLNCHPGLPARPPAPGGRPTDRCCLSDSALREYTQCSVGCRLRMEEGERVSERGGWGDRSTSHSLLNLQSWLRSWSALASFSRKPPSRLGQIGLADADDSIWIGTGQTWRTISHIWPYIRSFYCTSTFIRITNPIAPPLTFQLTRLFRYVLACACARIFMSTLDHFCFQNLATKCMSCPAAVGTCLAGLSSGRDACEVSSYGFRTKNGLGSAGLFVTVPTINAVLGRQFCFKEAVLPFKHRHEEPVLFCIWQSFHPYACILHFH